MSNDNCIDVAEIDNQTIKVTKLESHTCTSLIERR